MTQLKDLASQAQAIAEAQSQAHTEALAAEVVAINQIVETVRPGLRSVCGRFRLEESVWWVGNTHTDSNTTRSAVSGLFIARDDDDRAGPAERKYSDGNTGYYDGSDVFLCAHGSGFYKVKYQGNWSRWQGSSSEWKAELTHMTVEQAVETFKHITVESVIAALTKAFNAVIAGEATTRTEAYKARTAKLSAIQTLLG